MTRYCCCVCFELLPGLQGGVRVRRGGQNETFHLTYKELKRTEDKPFEDFLVAIGQRHMCSRRGEKVSKAIVVVRASVAVTQGRQPNQLRKIVSEFRKGALLEIILRSFYVHAFEGVTHKLAP